MAEEQFYYSRASKKQYIRAFVFNVLDLDNPRIRKDNKKVKCIEELLKDNVILKPDKGEGVVNISRCNYRNSMEALFSDRRRFCIIREDSTPTRLNSIQRYLQKLLERGEINETTNQLIRPQAAKPARAHGLPKIHKKFDKIPKSRIESIDPALFEQGIKYVSFDIESLITNVPLERTLQIFERRVTKELSTKLKRSTLRKLVRDNCKKTIFSRNDVYYEQTDAVITGGSLGPVLANIILTEFEPTIINPLISHY